jgi:hypothetical protein
VLVLKSGQKSRYEKIGSMLLYMLHYSAGGLNGEIINCFFYWVIKENGSKIKKFILYEFTTNITGLQKNLFVIDWYFNEAACCQLETVQR